MLLLENIQKDAEKLTFQHYYQASWYCRWNTLSPRQADQPSPTGSAIARCHLTIVRVAHFYFKVNTCTLQTHRNGFKTKSYCGAEVLWQNLFPKSLDAKFRQLLQLDMQIDFFFDGIRSFSSSCQCSKLKGKSICFRNFTTFCFVFHLLFFFFFL